MCSTHKPFGVLSDSFHTGKWAPSSRERSCPALPIHCHLCVWSLLTSTCLVKITFLTSLSPSKWGMGCHLQGYWSTRSYPNVIYRMASVHDERFSRWIRLCLLFKNIQFCRLIRWVLLWESLLLKLGVTFINSWRETENHPHKKIQVLSTVVLQNIWDSPDAYSTVLSEKRTSANRNLSTECFPFFDWLFSLNSILAYGSGQIAFLVLFVWGPCLGNHRKHFQKYFQRLAGHTIITLALFLAEHCTCLFMSARFMHGLLPQWQELRAVGVRWCQLQPSQLRIFSGHAKEQANSSWRAEAPSPQFFVLDGVVLIKL